MHLYVYYRISRRFSVIRRLSVSELIVFHWYFLKQHAKQMILFLSDEQ